MGTRGAATSARGNWGIQPRKASSGYRAPGACQCGLRSVVVSDSAFWYLKNSHPPRRILSISFLNLRSTDCGVRSSDHPPVLLHIGRTLRCDSCRKPDRCLYKLRCTPAASVVATGLAHEE